MADIAAAKASRRNDALAEALLGPSQQARLAAGQHQEPERRSKDEAAFDAAPHREGHHRSE